MAMTNELDSTARKEEELYVHQVYETIAEHFSRTRYKPWPGISNFFKSLPTGSIGIDAGCGNGKYLGLRSILIDPSSEPTPLHSVKGNGKGKKKATEEEELAIEKLRIEETASQSLPILTIGLDRSSQLVKIAKGRQHEVLVGDAIDMPWRDGAFDFAISIATIHHFTTSSRRKESIKTILRALNKKHGKLFIQVWALEQDPPSAATPANDAEGQEAQPKPIHRKQREMNKLAKATLESVDQTTEEGDDGGGQQEGVGHQDVFVPWKLQPKPQARTGKGVSSKATGDTTTVDEQQAAAAPPAEQTYQRYYHLFKGGELRELVVEAAQEMGLSGSLSIDEFEEWEQGNWCIQAQFGAPKRSK